MSFQMPSRGQEQQRNKILEDIQRKQQLLKQQSIGGQSTPQTPAASTPAVTGAATTEVSSSMSTSQKAALSHAHSNSFGYFITQDSSFGNLILPVLPRF